MTDKDFDLFIQNQLAGNGHNSPDDYESLTDEQRNHYQINKRAIKRISYYIKKQTKNEAQPVI
jgi:hypothetical protein